MIPLVLEIHRIIFLVDFEMLVISPKTNNLLVSNFSLEMGGILDKYFRFTC
jgi:hypothetical protein